MPSSSRNCALPLQVMCTYLFFSCSPTAPQVPKAFKVIPNLQNWEEILYLTEPESWTPHAVYQVQCRSGGRVEQVAAWRVARLTCPTCVRSFHPY